MYANNQFIFCSVGTFYVLDDEHVWIYVALSTRLRSAGGSFVWLSKALLDGTQPLITSSNWQFDIV